MDWAGRRVGRPIDMMDVARLDLAGDEASAYIDNICNHVTSPSGSTS